MQEMVPYFLYEQRMRSLLYSSIYYTMANVSGQRKS